MVDRIVWFDIPTVNLDRAAAFYSTVLDCALEIEEFPAGRMAVFPHSGDDVAGCLYETDLHKPSADGVLVYFNVEGRLCDAVAAAAQSGGEILHPKHSIDPYGFRAIVLDTEGNRIALHSRSDS